MPAMSEGKTAHVVGAGLLGVGALFARFADDCGRVGARSATLLDDGARMGRASSLLDDGARASGRAAPLADDGATRLGRAGVHTDEALAGSARGGHVEGELAETAVDLGLEFVPDRGRSDPQREPTGPRLLTLPPPGESHVPKGSPAVVDVDYELARGLAAWRRLGPVGLLVYASGPVDPARRIEFTLPDGRRTDDEPILLHCYAFDANCVVLACPAEPAAQRDACAAAASELWRSSSRHLGTSISTFGAHLLDGLAGSDAARSLVVSRVVHERGDFKFVRKSLR